MARHEFTTEERQRGFETTMERYPFMARKWLRYARGMKHFDPNKFKPESGNPVTSSKTDTKKP